MDALCRRILDRTCSGDDGSEELDTDLQLMTESTDTFLDTSVCDDLQLALCLAELCVFLTTLLLLVWSGDDGAEHDPTAESVEVDLVEDSSWSFL